MKKGDKIIAIILIGIIMGWGIFQLVSNQVEADNRSVEIKVNDQVYESIPFTNIGDSQEIRVETERGYNIIKIDQDGAEVIEASCPDKICVHTPKVTNSRGIIACLPNRVSVEITGEEEDGLDEISN
ncbi:hypothetical protein EDC19_2255 [Natranaerovirga hydrolytica]|uniref:Uncharacterized protein n=1 Tax=Natranaerovirga hydrolytica TaxID=680378 RepID=A0A4R1ML09_9FIRM|nr:NusG domain II-containing protein [Natranaerovirga hydrolytica]TCK90493.1 hypothetical protein EDC19_2255 [Natranaerovirga hydrolytica]